MSLVAVVAACGPDLNAEATEVEQTEVMAAALAYLVEDLTLGAGQPPLPLYLVEDRTISLATFPAIPEAIDSRPSPRPITERERSAIEQALSSYGEVQWIADPGGWFTDLGTIANDAVILSVGEPIADAPGYLVPASLLCGNVCATWLTYRVELVQGIWQVTGTEGPSAVS